AHTPLVPSPSVRGFVICATCQQAQPALASCTPGTWPANALSAQILQPHHHVGQQLKPAPKEREPKAVRLARCVVRPLPAHRRLECERARYVETARRGVVHRGYQRRDGADGVKRARLAGGKVTAHAEAVAQHAKEGTSNGRALVLREPYVPCDGQLHLQALRR